MSLSYVTCIVSILNFQNRLICFRCNEKKDSTRNEFYGGSLNINLFSPSLNSIIFHILRITAATTKILRLLCQRRSKFRKKVRILSVLDRIGYNWEIKINIGQWVYKIGKFEESFNGKIES